MLEGRRNGACTIFDFIASLLLRICFFQSVANVATTGSDPHSALLISGCLSRSFGSNKARSLFIALLKADITTFPICYNHVSRCFFLPANAIRPGSRPCLIDIQTTYHTGSVVPQSLWTPLSQTVRLRHVEHARLYLPGIFRYADGTVGVNMIDALAGNYGGLTTLDEEVDIGGRVTIYLRISVCSPYTP